ncbi:unnamed protein product [Rodentolepis nana]|uniref:FCP1 homology domain-containing protein n=1 Tax=Rodentolepis nana TaxID=102285 RepID=A0A0R3T6I3_RODNA|nr:unnamed protein product [Rodentolepis nana]
MAYGGVWPRGVFCGDPDQLDEILGINEEALELPVSENQLPIPSHYVPTESALDPAESDIPDEFIIYVDESSDVIVITCEVRLPSKEHSVHLLCPLVPETRLCLENCRRVCSLPDCSDKPKLFSVECVEDFFVRDMYNIWKFRYIIDRHNAAVQGTWGCFHAGKSTDIVNVTAVLLTTTRPHIRLTTTNPILALSSERLNSHEPIWKLNTSWFSKTQSRSGKTNIQMLQYDMPPIGRLKQNDF